MKKFLSLIGFTLTVCTALTACSSLGCSKEEFKKAIGDSDAKFATLPYNSMSVKTKIERENSKQTFTLNYAIVKDEANKTISFGEPVTTDNVDELSILSISLVLSVSMQLTPELVDSIADNLEEGSKISYMKGFDLGIEYKTKTKSSKMLWEAKYNNLESYSQISQDSKISLTVSYSK